MPKIEIVRLGANHNLKPVGEVGEVVSVNEAMASAMVSGGFAEPVEDAKPVEGPKTEAETAAEREVATDAEAAERETREVGQAPAEDDKPKRGPGRPRKTDK